MYSREEILGMPAGRELDALVAEHVFEKQVVWTFGDEWTDSYPIDEHGKAIDQYSECIIDAWEVVEKMRLESWGVTITSWGHDETMGEDPWLVTFGFQGGPCNFMSLSFPEAACKAALLSLLKED